MRWWLIAGLLVVVLVVSGCSEGETETSPCDMIKVCETNEDCEYAWTTGGCYNLAYLGDCTRELREKGVYMGEAPPREGVTCTCENNKCITHG